ncbi:RNase adapter RapZ [Chitinilyticum piscinae]|uniref:RNase adapter RapZ n=1 Tax=Chitinilyticum piscinae TaxID=2866724 RepID=A0A8J7FP88_9NEIS|nr:RNase adapter RapZ [Chitinilyticum piscinae]MBE9610531.1 RNase adapter RapZ [Chitinilyticum piscinae]
MNRPTRVILLSGLSGAGKSVALRALEDLGFYCIDNLPAPLLPQAVGLLEADGYGKLAISVDARSAHNFASFPEHLAALVELGLDVQVLFLDAQDTALVRRYSESRRAHPLSQGKLTVAECVAMEREMLALVRESAQVIDTTGLSANQLRGWLRDWVAVDGQQMTLVFQSFGFKRGLPSDADFVFDARCLPNPFYDPVLRPLTGKDQPVADFLEAEPNVGVFISQARGMLKQWLPEFERDQRGSLTVAIGCTGGQHRSVYCVEQLAALFAGEYPVLIRHREQAHL